MVQAPRTPGSEHFERFDDVDACVADVPVCEASKILSSSRCSKSRHRTLIRPG